MPVYFHKEDVALVLKNSASVKRWIRQVIEDCRKKTGSVNFIFCSDNYLLEINRKYLSHDYFTDVITFDLSDNSEKISGDIYISIERVKGNAKKKSFEDELHRVMIHGVLHLLGFSDKTPGKQKQMRAMENNCLKML